MGNVSKIYHTRFWLKLWIVISNYYSVGTSVKVSRQLVALTSSAIHMKHMRPKNIIYHPEAESSVKIKKELRLSLL